MLKIENLNVNYGAIKAVRGISLEVKEKSIVTLIGANGAGKTTTLRTISGLLKPVSGKIFFEGQDITNMSPDKIVELGICQSPEGRMIFSNLTVKENLEMGAYTRKDKEHHIQEKIKSISSMISNLYLRFSRDLKKELINLVGRFPAVNSRCLRFQEH